MHYTNDAKQVKFKILKEVAKLAFSGELEKTSELPYKIIPGKKPQYRCCVYKEREIVRERVTLALGKTLPNEKENGIVTVIPAACEGCPINRYTVTTNCQKCLAKRCVSACKFGAIAVIGTGAYIDPDKCKECGRCAAACPYNAISDTLRPCIRSCPVNAISMDTDRQALIKYDSCIGCGACTTGCPFGAISDTSSMVDVINEIKNNKNVIATFAPALEGQFGGASVGMIKQAIKKLGFKKVYEVSLGADATAFNEAKELHEAISGNKKMTTSCCPAFFAMIEKYFPELSTNISNTVSPMTAISRYIKDKEKDSIVVFIGPCISKKQEIKKVKNTADYVITFDELAAMFSAQDIDPEKQNTDNQQDGSIYGKNFAVSGGVFDAVKEAYVEQFGSLKASCKKCAGASECQKALALLKAGVLPEDIIEGMVCENGCISGPATVLPYKETLKNRKALLKTADSRKIKENLEQYDMENTNMEV
ncbi:MAG: Fe hydrogenase [Eubacteriales bacterium SKADARSKE-1]|nr:Fe hydrogenase [Eubacteriales bacterium SKADARSKE-1]